MKTCSVGWHPLHRVVNQAEANAAYPLVLARATKLEAVESNGRFRISHARGAGVSTRRSSLQSSTTLLSARESLRILSQQRKPIVVVRYELPNVEGTSRRTPATMHAVIRQGVQGSRPSSGQPAQVHESRSTVQEGRKDKDAPCVNTSASVDTVLPSFDARAQAASPRIVSP